MASSDAPEYPYPGGTPGAEPPDPSTGKPGHFAWSNWIKKFVKNLDASLMAHKDSTSAHGFPDTTTIVLKGSDAAELGSGAAADNLVLTADGAGGVAWETVPLSEQAVTSVNGGVGDIVLGAAEVGAAPAVHQHTASEVSNLGNSATLNVGTIAGTVAAGNDSRFSNTRDPNQHAASHASGGVDAVTVAQSQVTGLVTALSGKAPLTSPMFSGTPSAPTPAPGDNDTSLATTAFVAAAIAAGPPSIHAASHAAAGADPVTVAESQVTGLTAALALKAPLASPALTGTPTAPTAAQGTNTTQVATTAHVATEVGLLVPKALYDANTILAATSDNTPAALTVPASSLVGRGAAGDIAALSPATVRSDFDLARLSTVGNLLTANQASVETDTTGWSAGSYSPTIERSVEQALAGSASLKWTATSASGAAVIVTGATQHYASVIAGQVYNGVAFVRCGVNARSIAVSIDWRTSSNGAVSSSIGAYSAATTTGWTRFDVTAIAPVGAAYARLSVNVTAPAIGDTFYADQLGLWAGAGGEWAMPGVPIVNLGTKVSHPNVDDVLVQRWDSSKAVPGWQTIHYDSGWRQVASWGTDGVITTSGITLTNLAAWVGQAGHIRVRRYRDRIVWIIKNGQSSAAAFTLGVLPTGFKGTIDQGGWGTTTNGWLGVGPSPGASTLLLTTAASGIVVRASAEIITDEAIPTSLPGTLVSAAPA